MTRLDSGDDSVPQHERPRDDADFVETRQRRSRDRADGLPCPQDAGLAMRGECPAPSASDPNVGSLRGSGRRTAQPPVLGVDERGVPDRACSRARSRAARVGNVAHPRVRCRRARRPRGSRRARARLRRRAVVDRTRRARCASHGSRPVRGAASARRDRVVGRAVPAGQCGGDPGRCRPRSTSCSATTAR